MQKITIDLVSVEELSAEELPESAAASTAGSASCFSSLGGSGGTFSSLSSLGG